MRRPDFFLVGAPKCGTTALYDMLGAHPEIFVSRMKEPDFFAADIRAAVPALKGRAIDDWSRYLELFSGAAPAQRVGEGSVSYLASRVAAAAIRERCPDARILMVLRDPADRLASHYRAVVAAGATRSPFSEWLAMEAKRESSEGAPIGPIVAGRYGLHLQRYLAAFSPAHIHIVWYENFVKSADTEVRETLKFLRVNPSRVLPTTLRRNETRVPRWPRLFSPAVAARLGSWATIPAPARLSAADRALGIDLYANDIRLLAGLTGRDLSRWTDPKG